MSYYVSPETALEYTRVLTHKMDVTPRDITEACIKIYSQFRAENPASSQCIYFDVTEQALLEFVNNNPDRYSYFNGKFCNENHGLFTGFGLYSPELRHIIDPRFDEGGREINCCSTCEYKGGCWLCEARKDGIHYCQTPQNNGEQIEMEGK